MNSPLTIYAAGPIDLGQDVPDWRKGLMLALERLNITGVMFDPATSYKCSKWGEADSGRSLFIEQVNRVALEMSNTFVACVPKKVPSVGTPIEIDFADKSNSVDQLFILTDIQRGKSVYLDNRFSEDRWVLIEDLANVEQVNKGLADLASRIARIVRVSTEFVSDSNE